MVSLFFFKQPFIHLWVFLQGSLMPLFPHTDVWQRQWCLAGLIDSLGVKVLITSTNLPTDLSISTAFLPVLQHCFWLIGSMILILHLVARLGRMLSSHPLLLPCICSIIYGDGNYHSKDLFFPVTDLLPFAWLQGQLSRVTKVSLTPPKSQTCTFLYASKSRFSNLPS